MKEMLLYMVSEHNSEVIEQLALLSSTILNSMALNKICRYLLKFEPKFRLRRRAIIPKREGSRKGWKEVKSKLKKTRGAERTKIYMSRKTDKREVIRA